MWSVACSGGGVVVSREASRGFRPTVSESDVRRIRDWHERAYAELQRTGPVTVSYLGLELVVPPDVFPPAPMSDLFSRVVLDEVRPTDRVLDMGCGSGSNALLAASTAAEVLAVDINPSAVACTSRNADANGVASRVEARQSDVFDDVEGRFDLILFDPPFRWFRPRDILEASITDENYEALTRFMTQVPDRLRDGGRVLLGFGTSGDLGYLLSLIDDVGLACEVLAERGLAKDGWEVDYYVYRLTRSPG